MCHKRFESRFIYKIRLNSGHRKDNLLTRIFESAKPESVNLMLETLFAFIDIIRFSVYEH